MRSTILSIFQTFDCSDRYFRHFWSFQNFTAIMPNIKVCTVVFQKYLSNMIRDDAFLLLLDSNQPSIQRCFLAHPILI